MGQTGQGNQWHCGTKAHVGTEWRGLVHGATTRPASDRDITRLDDLLHGQDRTQLSEQGWHLEDHRQRCREAGIAHRVDRRVEPGWDLTEQAMQMNQIRSRHQMRGEYAVRVVKDRGGFTAVRYRAPYKITVPARTMSVLSSLCLARRLSMAWQEMWL